MAIDFNRYAGKPHGPQDYQSLAMHIEAVRLVLLDDSLADKALATLLRWDKGLPCGGLSLCGPLDRRPDLIQFHR